MVVEIDWIVGDVSLCMAVIEVQLLADPSAFEASEEALDHRIVRTVSAPARALDRASGAQLGEKRVLVYWQ